MTDDTDDAESAENGGRAFSTNPERCPDHDVRLVGGECPLDTCNYEQ